jgi:hypothetical protein
MVSSIGGSSRGSRESSPMPHIRVKQRNTVGRPRLHPFWRRGTSAMLTIIRAWCRTIGFRGQTEGVPEPAPRQWRRRGWPPATASGHGIRKRVGGPSISLWTARIRGLYRFDSARSRPQIRNPRAGARWCDGWRLCRGFWIQWPPAHNSSVLLRSNHGL